MQSRLSSWRWLVWLSLDAPLVALVWTLAWSRQLTGSAFHAANVLVPLAIWLGYVADRLLDVRRSPGGHLDTERHAFYRRYQRTWLVIWLVALAVEFGLSLLWLDGAQWLRGVVLAGLSLGYALSLAWWRGWPRILYKRVAVSLLFAGGVLVFLPWGEEAGHAWLCLSLLALINLLQLTSWQAGSRRLGWFALQFACAAGLMLLVMPTWTGGMRIGLLASAVAMLLLQLWKRPREELDRLLPDVCLFLGGLLAWLG
ncbi:MAG: hypothetical protein Q7P63_14280 [Verrucomicrobiota bacterium JB022]|nr:hypothetical protein [Verrucomicrobiota bacterium JB022]